MDDAMTPSGPPLQAVPLHAPPPVRGWSLVELLVVLACVATLTHLAVPTYNDWMQRSQRAQARVALLQAAQWLERSAAANGRYPEARLVPSSVWRVDGLHYQLSASALTAQTYTLLATPQGAQASDACGVLTLTHLGERGVAQAQRSASDCWQR